MWMGNETAENGAVREQNAAPDGQRNRPFIHPKWWSWNKKDRGIAAAALLNHELIQP